MNSALRLRGEPTLDEMLQDPIVRLVMCRDGLTEADIRDVLRRTAQRLDASDAPPRLVA